MREIPLTQGKVALVDDADYEWLNQWKWFAWKSSASKTWYASRNERVRPGRGGYVQLTMHGQITGFGPRKTDHKDRNGLNNQRDNLRPAEPHQQAANRGLRSDNLSGARGLTWFKGKWQVRIRVRGHLIFLGYFKDKARACEAYRLAAMQYFGEFCPEDIMEQSHA